MCDSWVFVESTVKLKWDFLICCNRAMGSFEFVCLISIFVATSICSSQCMRGGGGCMLRSQLAAYICFNSKCSMWSSTREAIDQHWVWCSNFFGVLGAEWGCPRIQLDLLSGSLANWEGMYSSHEASFWLRGSSWGVVCVFSFCLSTSKAFAQHFSQFWTLWSSNYCCLSA